jgi:glycerol-3-phosphate dehydrogenase
MFAGLRPLVKGKSKKTAALSRDHLITIADSGLITIAGGKWTTYRRMAEDVVDIAIEKNNLSANPCVTKELKIYGYNLETFAPDILHLTKDQLRVTIKKAVNEEMCMTIEDFLSRRTRTLLLDAQAAINVAPLVADLMAIEMSEGPQGLPGRLLAENKDENWIAQQVRDFNFTAKNYLPAIN